MSQSPGSQVTALWERQGQPTLSVRALLTSAVAIIPAELDFVTQREHDH